MRTPVAPPSAPLVVALLLAALVTACSGSKPEPAVDSPTSADITAADLAWRVRTLADDRYEGRAPGTPPGEAAAQWIADEFRRIGAAPGNPDGTYFQTVGMVALTVDPGTSHLTIASKSGKRHELPHGQDAVYITRDQANETVAFEAADLVFVGHGVVAPEAGWNDYAGLDAKGKTVVMFVNDPGFATGDETLFNGRAMTYYGRWTYKFEEAARQGATAALIIHEDRPAAYGWSVVQASWSGEQADLVRADAGASRARLEGWITLDVATALFRDAGLDIDAMRAAANRRGFRPVPMKGLAASATIRQTIRKATSRNVIATVKGSEAPGEHLLLMAHWDHLGKGTNADPSVDVIHNGAIDNATGTAAILEIAEKVASNPPPRRSVTFLAVTLEESGLLGSAYFAENPLLPLKDVVGGINLDALQPGGPAKDVIVIGAGASQLEDTLKSVLDTTGRVIRPDPEPENGYFYRSDHVSLAKTGVPMLYVRTGIDRVTGGTEAGEANLRRYTAELYHKPSDEYADDWDLTGMEADMRVHHAVIDRLARSRDWPNWHDGNEFRAARDAQRGASAQRGAPTGDR